MENYQGTFERYEKKYLLNPVQYELIYEKLMRWMEPDVYPEGTICNIYYDTPDRRLIRRSLEGPVYKEKLRLRSYGIPDDDSSVFIELKKKYRGIVYKRRVDSTLDFAVKYLESREAGDLDSQVFKEIDWFLSFYREVIPSMYIAYHRSAWRGKEESELRLTFDDNIVWREEELNLKAGIWGNELLESGQRLMEVKIPGAMPLWMAEILDELHIRPVSLSKYGRGYQETLKEGDRNYA